MKNSNKKSFVAKFYLIILQLLLFILFSRNTTGYTQQSTNAHLFLENNQTFQLPDFIDSYGVVFRDLDNNTFPDIYIVRFRNLNRLFLNTGKNDSFIDYTIESQLGGNLNPRGKQNLELGTSSTDFNNDGKPDIAIGGWGVSTRIFKQENNFRFTDITKQLNLKLPLDGNGVFWADVNIDGYLDMFITDERNPDRLFLGDGRDNFSDKSNDWGITHHGVSQGAAFADVDLDGYPDLYVCNWFGSDKFYRNSGEGNFEPILLPMAHLNQTINSNGVCFGDIDNDGDLDILVTDRNGRSALYRNDTEFQTKTWKFTDITAEAELRIPFPAYGTIIADLNNDGWQDIWVNCIGPNILFLNQGINYPIIQFERHFLSSNFDDKYSTGAAIADIELDGDLDLFVANKDTNSILYLNTTNNHNYIQLKLVGVESNRDAIGSKIWLYERITDGETKLTGFREISGGGGYLSQNSPIVNFGADPQKTYDIQVQFPNGEQLTLNKIVGGTRQTVYELGGLWRIYYRGWHYFYRMSGQSDFWINVALFFLLISILIWYIIFSNNRYLWSAKQSILFLSLTIIIIYGIFLSFQNNPLKIRLLLQILSICGFFIFLSYFLEKIRRLEIARSEYRHLLEDFSKDLIFIKENSVLYEKLVKTIFQAIQPSYCVYYKFTEETFIRSACEGQFSGPNRLTLPTNLYSLLKSENSLVSSEHLNQPAIQKGYLFPIKRADNILGLLILGSTDKSIQNPSRDQSTFQTLATQAAIAIENNQYIEETKKLIQKVTEAEIREKYVEELEHKNEELQNLYQNLKATQIQLIQSEKMASLGQLVAGIAHELNNPIGFVYANMFTLKKYMNAINKVLALLKDRIENKLDEDRFIELLNNFYKDLELDFIKEDISDLISDSLNGSRRVKEVVLNLRNFSRLDEADTKNVNIHDGLNSTLLILTNEIKNKISIHKNYGILPLVQCKAGQINQVFMNLLINAIQAIPKTGNIWISTRVINNNVEIKIKDDGEGIPQSIRHKIFDPFFTTKPVGSGTGLGLSICYKIINEHGGTINIESEEKIGTTFIVTLPIKKTNSTDN